MQGKLMAVITIVSTKGQFAFADYDLPLVTRRVTNNRKTDQGHSRRVVSINLDGFFTGNKHSDVVDKYQKLKNILDVNDAKITYNDGSNNILYDKTVYIDSLNEPQSWKQYSGDYSIAMHYHEEIDNNSTGLGIIASYVSEDGTYTFSPVPLWSRGKKPGRNNWRQSLTTFNGKTIGGDVNIKLQGILVADEHVNLHKKIVELENKFSKDGTLNYGSFSNAVKVSNVNIGSVFPRDYCEYSIDLNYNSEVDGVHMLSTKRTFSRTTLQPKIRERPFCGDRIIQLFNTSGQRATYRVRLRSSTVDQARSLLADELANLVTSGGIEMDGGSEEWDYDSATVSVTIVKYHSTPILSNI